MELPIKSILQIPKIKEVLEFLSCVPKINCGGCGISAIVIYDILVESGLKPEIIYFYDDDDDDYYDNLIRLHEGDDNILPCGHAVVKIGKIHLDAYGIANVKIYPLSHTMSRDAVIKSLNVFGWNVQFNRRRFLPKIEAKIGYKLGINLSI